MPKSSKKAGRKKLYGVGKKTRSSKKENRKLSGVKGKSKPATGSTGGTQNSYSGLNIYVAPQEIDETSINQLANKNKFPVQGQTVKTKPGIDGSGMVVAILDTGVFEHNDLKGKIIDQLNFEGKRELITDRQGHGTHIAGIIAGNQSKEYKNVKGIAPGAKIVSVKITIGDLEETALWHIADGLERIREHNKKSKQSNKVTAIVICFNAFDRVERFVVTQHHRLAQLIKEFYDENIPVICSSGNNFDKFQNQTGIAYPAYLQHVIACPATYNNPTDKRFGQYTDFAQRMDPNNRVFNNYYLPAPGYQTISTGIKTKSSYTIMSGSSQAAAVIAGTILLIQHQSYLVNKKLPGVDQLVDLLKNQRS